MFSTGEVCIVTPTPLSDPDQALMAEIGVGSTLLDLDLEQQRQPRYGGPSPSPSITGFGFPPSPADMAGSFYPEQYFGMQPMGVSTHQQGDAEMTEIEENEMVRLLSNEMFQVIWADCQKLGLHPNMYSWSPVEVQKWLKCVVSRYELGEVNLSNFYVDGMKLGSMQDAEFRQRAPKCGDILFSIVYLLKSSIHMESAPQVVPQVPMVHIPPPQQAMPIPSVAPTDFMAAPRYSTAAPISPVQSPRDYESGSTGSPSDDESSIPSPVAPTGPNTSMTPNHTGGIQLWQFLKELLLQPNSYSYCIRWIDRTQGIFKIEDSVEVARLWGLRKNRPAMNYDKLSRSIRQYYRKGIMKKTEVSQRLVYQFVHPC